MGLHVKTIYVCVLDASGQVLVDRNVIDGYGTGISGVMNRAGR